MRIGILADAHGNLPGLTAALAELDYHSVDRLVFLGDAVGYYPQANEVIALLRNRQCIAIQGNHDQLLLSDAPHDRESWPRYRLDSTARTLSAESAEWLRSLPARRELDIDGERVLLCHGSPWQVDEYVYPDSNLARFAELEHDVVLCGHTHIPFSRMVGDVLLVNPGSCGQPRDYKPGACAAVLELKTHSVTFIRASYDIQKYEASLRAAGVPPAFLNILTRTRQEATPK